MLFTPEEAAVIVSALETYDGEPHSELKAELRHTLCVSASSKLESLTALTVFTKQEFSVMAMALGWICRTVDVAGYSVESVLPLYNRLLDLASA